MTEMTVRLVTLNWKCITVSMAAGLFVMESKKSKKKKLLKENRKGEIWHEGRKNRKSFVWRICLHLSTEERRCFLGKS